jgi:hypothetical protein
MSGKNKEDMRERTNMAIIEEADRKSVQEARKVLAEVLEKSKNLSFVEIVLGDPHNTSIIVVKEKYNRKGKKFFLKKYRRVLALKKKTHEVISRNIIRSIG